MTIHHSLKFITVLCTTSINIFGKTLSAHNDILIELLSSYTIFHDDFPNHFHRIIHLRLHNLWNFSSFFCRFPESSWSITCQFVLPLYWPAFVLLVSKLCLPITTTVTQSTTSLRRVPPPKFSAHMRRVFCLPCLFMGTSQVLWISFRFSKNKYNNYVLRFEERGEV